MGLLVVEKLDPVLDTAQEDITRGQRLRGVRLHQAAVDQPLQAAQRAACADLGELPAADDQHQLDDEFDLADAAARQLDVVGAVGAACGAGLGLLADLVVQLAQALENAVVEVAAVDEGRDQRTQRQRASAFDRAARSDDAALEPGKPFPLAALHLQVLFQHRQADHRRPRVAVRPQGQVDAEDETVLGGVADQRIQPLDDVAEVFVERHRARTGAVARGQPVFFVDVDQVDVGRDVQLARAELAHADDPQLDTLALFVQWRAMPLVGFRFGLRQRQFERRLGQRRHAGGDVVERRAGFGVQHRQPLDDQVARDPQRGGQFAAAFAQLQHQLADLRRIRQAGRQPGQLLGVAAAYALNEAAVRRADRTDGRGRCAHALETLGDHRIA